MPSAGVATGNLMAGKKGLIMGVANNRSIAWGIAKAAAAQGAEIALTYQGDAIKKRVGPLATELGSKLVLPCDVMDASSVDAVFAEAWLRGVLDGADPAVAVAAERLMAVQRRDAAANRNAWPEAWDRASRKKLRSWL